MHLWSQRSLLPVFLLWRKGFREDDRRQLPGCWPGLFFFHTVALFKRGFSLQACPVNNLYEATTFLLWALALAYLAVGLLPRLKFLGTLVTPVLFSGGVFALMPALDAPHGPQPEFSGALRSLHAATILLAYGGFGLGAVAAGMLLTQRHDLKMHKIRAVLSLLPSMQRFESVTTTLVRSGFILFTIGLVAGRDLPRPPGLDYFSDPESRLVGAALAGVFGNSSGAPIFWPFHPQLRGGGHCLLCIFDADVFDHQPLLVLASSMSLVVIGLNHRTSPVELRERFAFEEEKIPAALQFLNDHGLAGEAVIVSTCNRVEIYAVTSLEPNAAFRELKQFLVHHGFAADASAGGNSSPDQLGDAIYTLNEPQSLHHLFKVASGLDSMVVGETEIFGQLKKAYELARCKTGAPGPGSTGPFNALSTWRR